MGEQLGAVAGATASAIRVAVADDDDDVVAVLCALIRGEEDLELIGVATDAEAAIELAITEHPDVVLLDVRMPGGGGLRAAREIARRCTDTRVIALSAHEDEVTMIQMMGAGAHAYVPKSASTDRIIREILREHRPVAPTRPSRSVWGTDRSTGRSRHDERRERILDVIEHDAISVTMSPVFDVDSGVLVGGEVTPRFARIPVRGPDGWFAEAESVGLLAELELAALDAAILSLEHIPAHAFVVVDLSPSTIVGATLHALPDARRLVLRITEHANVDDYVALSAGVRSLRESGIRIAVGDVGAGIANLRHVVNIGPDLLIVDASLTRGIESDAARHAVVAAITSCAEQLDARVIATGVTTLDQLDELTRLGVHLFEASVNAEPSELGGITWEAAIAAQPHHGRNVRRLGTPGDHRPLGGG